LTIINSEFYGNSAVIGGGALSLTGNSGNHLIIGSTLSDKSAKVGGAIAAYSPVTVTNSTIYSNSAHSGGAIYVGDIQGNLTVSNSTLSHNWGNFMGGGIYNSRFLKMSNSIIANSSAGGDCVDTGTIVVNENNLIGDGSCFPAYDGDPLLGLLQDNGGATETMVPMVGSIAIDNGDDAYCEMLDQRGWLRPIDGDGNGTAVCDIGAVEVGPWLEFMAAVFRP
jgi:hypothetical protein